MFPSVESVQIAKRIHEKRPVAHVLQGGVNLHDTPSGPVGMGNGQRYLHPLDGLSVRVAAVGFCPDGRGNGRPHDERE